MRERYELFTSLVVNINRYILKIKKSEMEELGLKGNQVQCLYYLYNEENGLSAKQLGALCEEDKAATSRTLKDLEMRELIFVAEEGSKKYGNPYKLTARGQEYGKKVALKIDGVMELASRGIGNDERTQMYSSLQTICNNLKNICERSKA